MSCWRTGGAVLLTALAFLVSCPEAAVPYTIPVELDLVLRRDPAVTPLTLPEGATFSANALYVDVVQSITDLIREADLIVRGTVVSQHQVSHVAVASTVEIARSARGTAPDGSLTIFQLGRLGLDDEDLLTPGVEYLLFLGKQGDGNPNTFYIKGGNQGIFSVHSGRLSGRDGRLTGQLTKAIGRSEDPLTSAELYARNH